MVESRSPSVLTVIPTVLNTTTLTTLIVSVLGQFDFGHDFQNQFQVETFFLSCCSSGINWTHFGNIYCRIGIFVIHRKVNIKVMME